MEIKLSFTRVARVKESGKARIEVINPEDIEAIKNKMRNNDFKQFVITEREYEDIEWKVETEDRNDNEAA